MVAELEETAWLGPTPAEGWTVAHQIAHLAWTDQQALLAATDPEGFTAAVAEAAPRLSAHGRRRGRAPVPPSSRKPCWRAGGPAAPCSSSELAALPEGTKLPWFGPPMSAASMATARLMETWAHGLDVTDALRQPPSVSARLRHIAHIGVRTRDFAFAQHGLPAPGEPFRVELTAPDGDDVVVRTGGRRPAGHRPGAGLLPAGHPAPAPRGPRAAGHRAGRRPLARPRPGLRRSAGPGPSGLRDAGVTSPLRIGNASGFYGDRRAAVREMLEGGPLDVLTGDYLAELTMLILGRDRAKDASRGYARTFLAQLEECLGLAVDRGVRIVVNAGGLNPAGLADAVRGLAERLGLPVAVGHVEGDDLLPRAGELGLGAPLTANAYLGAFGIAECLRAGADVVVTGRVTDASLVVGPGIAHFGWGRDDLDALAGAVVAGHVLECGAQATGGNLSAFHEHPVQRLLHPGFPLAELSADGSCVITKHPDTGGVVDRDTVTAQLLYEITGPRYAGPDVVARFDTIELADDGPDRVRISGVRGELPPPTAKVCLNSLGGHRNEVTFVLTGDRIEAKAAFARAQFEAGAARPPRGAGVVAARGRPPRRGHGGRRERAAPLPGARPLARTWSDGPSAARRWRWRWPAIPAST